MLMHAVIQALKQQLPQGMQADPVSPGIVDDSNESIFTNGHFITADIATISSGTTGFDRAVFAAEINHRATCTGWYALHPDQSARRPVILL